jgi:hypothetical protein
MASIRRWKRFALGLSQLLQVQFGCNVLSATVTSVEELKSTRAGQMHLPLLCQENRVTLGDMSPHFVICIAVEIDDSDYVVSSNRGVSMLDWELEQWIEGKAKTNVLCVGAIRSDEKRFRMFQWFVSGD